eukprot:Em0235g2a
MNSSGVVPAIDMALRDINNSSGLLPGYTLAYDRVRDSQCHSDRSLDVFFQAIQSAPVKLAIIGCGCSVATVPVAAISHHWNVSQISYFSESAALSDRSRYKRYFRTNPSGLIEYPAFYSIMNHFGWKQIAVITQNEDLFITTEANIRNTLKVTNFTVTSSTFDTTSNPWTSAKSLFAAKLGYKYPHYAWIIQHWYPDKWWIASPDEVTNCTENELESFLGKALSIRIHPSPDEYFDISDAGIFPQQFQTEYELRARQNGYIVSDAGGRAYDAIWVLARALNHTMAMVKSGNINGTHCENATGSLVPLEQFNYSNEKMGCLIQWNIQQTNISGVSLKEWLFIIGYALCFGTVLAKMWRIYYIFQNPRTKKMLITDWHMLFIVVTMVGIGILLLMIGTAVPSLRGSVVKGINDENPQGTTAGGVQVNYYLLMCYPTSSSPFYWKILILAYLAVYQIVGIVLAFETRKVKFPGLRESAFVATMIYISSLVLVMLAVDIFILSSYLNSYGAIFAIGILILTTIFLLFTFVPKMVLLYKGTELDISSFSVEGVPRKSCDLEARIASLEEILREKDKMIALFENQMIALKVNLKLIFTKQSNVLTFALITSFGQFGMNSSGVVPAIDMALRDINNSSGLLPGYTLAYDRVRDSQCHSDRSLDVLFQAIQSAPVKLAIIGCGCSVATEPVAAISHHWNVTQFPQQFQIEYELRARQNDYIVSDAGGRAYDAIWVLALALNHTMAMVKTGNINGTHCENATGSLVPLEQFNYSNEKMGCLLQWNIQQTNFSGVSGPIRFDENGTRIQETIHLNQYIYYGILLLMIETAVPSLRGTVVKGINDENPQGTTIVGIVLAFETRKVKFPGLRDSAFAATMIYISSLVLVMLAVDIFILSSYLNSHGAIFAIGILILTTIFLMFTFVPKMVLLCKGTELDISSFSVEGVPRKSCNLEAKIVSLEEILREKDKMIALFENQIITLKEQCEKNVSTC